MCLTFKCFKEIVHAFFFHLFLFSWHLFHFYIRYRTSQDFLRWEKLVSTRSIRPTWLFWSISSALPSESKARARRVWSWSCRQRFLPQTNCSDRNSVAKMSLNWKRRERGGTDYPDISDGHQVSVSGSTSAIKWSVARRRREQETTTPIPEEERGRGWGGGGGGEK